MRFGIWNPSLPWLIMVGLTLWLAHRKRILSAVWLPAALIFTIPALIIALSTPTAPTWGEISQIEQVMSDDQAEEVWKRKMRSQRKALEKELARERRRSERLAALAARQAPAKPSEIEVALGHASQADWDAADTGPPLPGAPRAALRELRA